MNAPNDADRSGDRRSPLRLDFVAPPLASTPPTRELPQTFEEFSAKTWKHPITNWTIDFSVSSIERWLCLPPSHPEDPVGTLRCGPRRVVLEILDSCSRPVCDARCDDRQTSETLTHTLSQVVQKHGVPRALMTDNGSSMIAAQPQAAIGDLVRSRQPTLCHSPHKTQAKRPLGSHSKSRKRGDLR